MQRVEVHRCRFLDWVPSAVQYLAFNHTGSLLAVARAHGDIEIWNIDNGWHVEKVGTTPRRALMLLIFVLQRLVGTDDSIRALVWIPNGETERLLSAGLGGSVVEWDLTTLKEKRRCDSYAGPIWSLSLSRSGEFLAVGCESGKVTWLDVSDGALQYKKSFQPAGKGTFALVFFINRESLPRSKMQQNNR